MSLQDLLKGGWLKLHKPTNNEIVQLLAVVDRDLEDAQLAGLSEDRKLATAYNAALQSASAALAASGYRVSREGYHYWTIQTLNFTLKLDKHVIEKLDKFRKKRNIGDYEMIGMVSEKESEEMCNLAIELRDSVIKWLHKNYPHLLQP